MAVSFEFERDRAYSRLVDLIFGGSFETDHPLSERKLAQQLGIGRMPVRDALRQLEQEGVVEVKPARGTFIRKLSAGDISDIYELREALECLAARRAAERGPSLALSACGEKMRIMARDPSAFTSREIDDVGTDFHDALIQSSASAPLAEMVRLMRMRFRLAFHLPRYFAHALVQEILVEHITIFEAIVDRQPEKAAELMRRHLKRGLEIRLELDRAPGTDKTKDKTRGTENI
ncbi:GntR family transcriptional regulator [Afifella marina]|uniref:DNA-binding transcriptional regulator, GntR family n=1 Tax=Afifella marina DSM 2698 TaxID=1120955 RepID=A0A1G5MME5_AFIMA|nr:GntR family transcriptional regulator [Afifella marina]SCZ26242.1 DNA-binding transcriptional regulator, GntR family [Afifella marina DSM 2698]